MIFSKRCVFGFEFTIISYLPGKYNFKYVVSMNIALSLLIDRELMIFHNTVFA